MSDSDEGKSVVSYDSRVTTDSSARSHKNDGTNVNSDDRSSNYSRYCPVRCTICSKQINPFFGNDLCCHPFLDVIVCRRCFKFLTNDSWTLGEDGKEEHCCWCGEGGEIFVCDYCPKGICKMCLRKNLGRGYVSKLEQNIDQDEQFAWHCLACDAKDIKSFQLNYEKTVHMVNQQRSRRQKSAAAAAAAAKKTPSAPSADDDDGNPQSSLAILKRRVERYEKLYANAERNGQSLKTAEFLAPLVDIGAEFCRSLKRIKTMARREQEQEDFRGYDDAACPESALKVRQAIHHVTDGLIVASSFYERVLQTHRVEETKLDATRSERKSFRRRKRSNGGSGGKAERIPSDVINQHFQDAIDSLTTGKSDIPETIDPPVADSTAIDFSVIELDQSRSSDESDSRRAHKHEASDAVARSIVDAPLTALDIRDETARTVADYKFIRGTVSKFDPAPKIDFNEDCNKEKKRVRSKTTASKSSSATATKSLSESAIENYAQENRIRDGTNKGTESIHSAKRRAWKSEPDDDDCVSDLNTDQPIVVNNDKRLRLSDDLITVDLLDAGLTVDSVHGVAKNKIAPADREKKRRASDDASESADGNDDDASKSSDCPLDVFNLNEDAGDVIGGQEKSAKNSIASRKIKRGRDRVSDDNSSLTGDDGLDEQLKRADRLLRSMNNALGVGAGRKSSSKEQGKESVKKRQNVIKDTSSTDDMDLGDDDFETRDLKDEVTNAWSEIECPAEGSFKGFIDSRISLDQKPKSYSSDSSDSPDTELLASSEAKKMATTRQMKRKALGEEEGQQLSVVDGVAAEEIISTSDDVATVAKSKFDTNVDKLLKIRLSVRLDDIGKIKDAKKINGDALPATKRRHAKAIVVSSSSNDNDENKNDSLTTSDEEDDDNDDFKPRSNRRLDRRPKVGGDADDDVDDDADNDDEDDDADFNVRKTRGDRNGVKRRRESSSTTSQDDDDSDVVVVGGRRRRGGGKAKKAGGSRGRPRRRVAVSTDEEIDDDPANASKTGRTNIRKIQKASALQLDAYEEEKERRRRINEKQKIYNEMSASQEASTSAIPTECTSLVLDRHEETKDVLVEVHPSICKRLKPHQVEGVRFMYQCTVESVEKAESAGTGCILAHCMGLGKTFQVVAYLHTLLTHERLKTKTALVLAPLNVVLNWEHEFKHWLEDEDEELSLNIWELASVKNNEDRAKTVDTWQENGGVLILSYNLFLMLVDDSDKAKKKIKKEKWRQSFLKGFLDPGPDVVVCDEGHMLKNEKTGISKAVNKIRTLRRICLTGTPLQNNLKEYYTMVQFVKPNLLGTRLEFSNRFENPIKNGQYQDSTQADVRLMKKRAHILHEMLSGCVQRQNYTALSTALPPKYEYVLSISLSEEQIKLYQKYLTEVVVSCDAQSLKERRGLFADYQALQRIWTHPYALLLHTEKMDVKERLQEEKDFVVSGDSDSSEFSVYADADVEVGEKKKSNKDSNSNENDEDTKSNEQNNADDDDVEVIKPWKTRTRDGTTKEPVADNFADMPKLPSENQDWYGDAVTEEAKEKLEISGKIFLLFEIIRKCEAIGDKLLVFSQSLVALDIIENFLEFYQKNGWTAGVDSLSSLYGWKWRKDKDYFRLDGSTPAERRKALSKIFNDPANLRSRLFLISTRAGSLGMNLFGANRVVIFDTNWNPTHDTQSMFRVYRFGQTKPVYVYRFIAHGTMEAKIYERGVTKQSLACRVVDEQQIDRHFLGKDLEALYEFTPKSSGKEKLNTLAVPKDRLLADLLFEQKQWVVTYHEHDTLLQNMEEEQLTKEERELAWAEYENERKNPPRAAALQLPTDKYQVYCQAMPLLTVLVAEGDSLIRMSGEKVEHSMESIIRNWINTDQEIMKNPSLVVSKAQQLVMTLRDMLSAKMTQINAANRSAAPPTYPATYR